MLSYSKLVYFSKIERHFANFRRLYHVTSSSRPPTPSHYIDNHDNVGRTYRRRLLQRLQRQRINVSNRHVSTAENRDTVSVNKNVPDHARVVICGGGVIGASVAYHLAKMGWTDVVLLEQGSLTCGTTWHSAGLIGQFRGSYLETAIMSYSRKLYKELEEQGYPTGMKECGSISLARTPERITSFKRSLIHAERNNVELQLLTPKEIQDRVPILKTDDLMGGVWIPSDAALTAPDLCMSLARAAKDNGVKIIEGVEVKEVLTKNARVCGVETSNGHIQCEYFINCAGQWARKLGKCSNPRVRVPLHSCEHFYLVTKPMPQVDPMMPVVRDYDGYVYVREWSGGILGGGFEPVGKPVFHDGIPPKFEYQLLPEDWDHFQILLNEMLHRVPIMNEAEARHLTNGPESFTPDAKPIVGEAPEVDNYFIAAGMNSAGIVSAGGIGKLMAEWVIHGEPSVDMWMMDARRFVDLHNNRKFLRDRVKETISKYGMITFPNYELTFTTGRKLRTSPLYTRHEELKGIFGQSMAFERALWFAEDSAMHTKISFPGKEHDWQSGRQLRASAVYVRLAQDGGVFSQIKGYERALWFKDEDEDHYDSSQVRGTFHKPHWFDHVRSEYWACREGVCLMDMSSFSKFEIRSAGKESVKFLQYLCSNDVDKAQGTIVHTGMHNHHGGYENDCSLVRLADNHYFMIAPTSQQTRSYVWMNDHLPADGSVQLTDVTSMYTAINVIGPKAQELLQELTDTSMTKADFQTMTCKEIDVGHASRIKAMRLTHSGEDGWMLYIPSEYALHVYDSLMAVGKDYGIRNAGYYALRAMRIEKFFAYWGQELTPQSTPLECGREFRVKYEKGNFIGHGALMRQKVEGVRKKLVQFLVEDHNSDEDPWPWGGEPIYRNGKFAGMTTSSAFGYTLDHHVCLGFVADYDDDTGDAKIINHEFVLKDAHFEIDIAGKRFPCKAGIYPPTLKPVQTGVALPGGRRQH